MRFCRFQYEGALRYGLVENAGGKKTVTAVLSGAPSGQGAKLRAEIERPVSLPVSDVELLAPVEPGKIVCVGRNYREHAAELGNEIPAEPLIFLKPPSSLLAPDESIIRPAISARVDFEGELGVVIGKKCSKLQKGEDVRPYILGYTCVNDVTARDLQKKDGQWTRGKGFDTFCPLGPVVSDELDPWRGVGVQTRVNGELRQDGNTRDFIFPLDAVIHHIAQFMTLVPGDLIATGTPQGVGSLVAGDVVEVTVEGVGTLRNRVNDEVTT